MKITIVGLGYVGLSNGLLLSKKNEVIALDINQDRVDLINARKSPIDDQEIESFLRDETINFRATLDTYEAFHNSKYIIIATPTNYDPSTNFFDTSSIEQTLREAISINSEALIIIKSTIPIGYVKKISKIFNHNNILFSPEFLREGKALYDNLYPSRIIVGEKSKRARDFSNLLVESAIKKNIKVLFTDPDEAEAIKLFANTYLAMRISYFNEIDTFASSKGLDTKQIIDGVSHDPRIGNHYNNPSFGYGGYCLPKDTKQLLANFDGIPNSLISAIVEANIIRKDYIANTIVKQKPNLVGIYRLIMKSDSDNFRDSAVLGIIKRLRIKGIKLVIYEPVIQKDEFDNIQIIKQLDEFKNMCEIIIANRQSEDIADVSNKVISSDLFECD